MPKVFPRQRLRAIFRKVGAERVSSDALEELKDVLVRMVERLTSDALEVAKHAKRVTILREDIRLAAGD
jgi:histone H3/H4